MRRSKLQAQPAVTRQTGAPNDSRPDRKIEPAISEADRTPESIFSGTMQLPQFIGFTKGFPTVRLSDFRSGRFPGHVLVYVPVQGGHHLARIQRIDGSNCWCTLWPAGDDAKPQKFIDVEVKVLLAG